MPMHIKEVEIDGGNPLLRSARNAEQNDEEEELLLSEDKKRSSEYLKRLSRNISIILDSFKENYDKRVRPNYGGKILNFFLWEQKNPCVS